MTQPLFPDEGPQYYAAAYAHNKPFATAGPYQTRLSSGEEAAFRQWVSANRVPFDPNANIVDYDMRGYWKDTQGRDWTPGSHFPDTYKTPYDTTFSAESKYATPNNPFRWQGDNLIDTRDGTLIFGTPTAPAQQSATRAHPSGYGTQWHLEAVRPDGQRRVVQASMRSSAGGKTHWDAQLYPGESIRVVANYGTIST